MAEIEIIYSLSLRAPRHKNYTYIYIYYTKGGVHFII